MKNKTNDRSIRLRKLRYGVSLDFYGYDQDGIPQWKLYDGLRNKNFLVGKPEFEMLSRWYLSVPEKIIESVNQETTFHVDMDDFENLHQFLYHNSLLEERWRNIYKNAIEQKVIKGENLFYWFIRYYLFFRIPLFHPDNFLNRTKFIGDFLFSKYTFIVMCLLGVLAIYQIGLNWDLFTHTFSTIFSWEGLVIYLIIFTLAKCFHEFGHAYMCKRYGKTVPSMGLAFLVFWPVLYTDTTPSWSLPSHQRLRIALAGMWLETYFTILAALIWANVNNLTLQMICYITLVNWLGTLLINVSPFMRFDGYYALSDFLKMPNLQNRAFAIARWQIRYWLFGLEDPPPEQFSKKTLRILVCYSFTAWFYRLFIYFGIAILVYHYFFKIVGIILFLIELFAFILRPIRDEFRVWYNYRNKFTLNRRTIITAACGFIFLIILFLPMNASIKMNATLSYNHEYLYSKESAVLLDKLPDIGTFYKKDEIIVRLSSNENEHYLIKSKLEYDKTAIALRRSTFSESHQNELSSLQAELQKKEAEYNKYLKLKDDLIIRAPFDGIIKETFPDLKPGDTVKKNLWLVNIIQQDKLIVEAYVEQGDFNLIKVGEKGKFYPLNLSEPAVIVKVVAIEPVNTIQLSRYYSKSNREASGSLQPINTPGYEASELGGQIPTNLSQEGTFVPVESIYRVILEPLTSAQISNVLSGTVILTVEEERPFISQIIYKLKTVFSQESGF